MIFGIQILRGIAATLVVFAHLQSHTERFGTGEVSWLGIGGSGVDIFFVISGFIIWTTSQSVKVTAKSFLIRRAIRIVPLYWLITGFIALVALVAPSLLSSTVFDLRHVVASFCFAPYPHPVLHDPYPLLIPGWTLNYEAFFYAIFAVSLLLPTRLASFYLVNGVLAVLTIAGFLLSPTNYVAYYYTDPIIIEFAFGLCVGRLYTDGPKFSLWLGIVAIPIGLLGIVASGLAGWVDDHHVRFYAIGLPAVLVVFGITVLKRHQLDFGPLPLVAVGDASYSIYLTQVITIPIGVRLWSFSSFGYGPSQLLIFIVAQVVLAVGIGWIVHYLIERPLLDRLRGFASGKRHTVEKVAV